VTATRAKVLSAIADLTVEHRIPPTLREIATTVGLCVSTTAYHVRVLTEAGVITHRPGSPRSITITEETK
jgi:predicted transcriptional regulator